MNNISAQQSKHIDSKTKQELISQSEFMKNNASLYLDLHSIPMNGNGKIVITNNNIKSKAKKIKFSSLDSINSSIEVIGKTGLLISCSHHRAGGGWLSGSIAQEESVSRATTWATQAELAEFNSWYKQESWLGQSGALVIDGLLLFNQNNEELITPKEVVFAGVAAANKARLNQDKYWDSEKGINERKNYLINNIACALDELNQRGVKNVILCAFGTNVFGWKLEESISVLYEASKYAPFRLNLICAMASEHKKVLAEEIYDNLLSEDITNGMKNFKKKKV